MYFCKISPARPVLRIKKSSVTSLLSITIFFVPTVYSAHISRSSADAASRITISSLSTTAHITPPLSILFIFKQAFPLQIFVSDIYCNIAPEHGYRAMRKIGSRHISSVFARRFLYGLAEKYSLHAFPAAGFSYSSPISLRAGVSRSFL